MRELIDKRNMPSASARRNVFESGNQATAIGVNFLEVCKGFSSKFSL